MTDYEQRKIAKYVAKELSDSVRTFDEWLNIQEAAKMMGCAVSTVRQYLSRIPHHKPFKQVMFSKRELEDYMRSH